MEDQHSEREVVVSALQSNVPNTLEGLRLLLNATRQLAKDRREYGVNRVQLYFEADDDFSS